MSILVSPEDIWGFFWEHKEELSSKYLAVAEDEDAGIVIYMTEEGGLPYFQVEVDGSSEYEVETTSGDDAEESYKNIIKLYIDQSDEGFDDDDLDRLDDIHNAVEDMLNVMLEGNIEEFDIDENALEEIASIVEQYLADMYGVYVRHPIEVEDKIIQYPFDPEELE